MSQTQHSPDHPGHHDAVESPIDKARESRQRTWKESLRSSRGQIRRWTQDRTGPSGAGKRHQNR